ncbi:hypothetical protein IRJ41_014104 [Triplophysa rosa]|uniref:Uncharacterized protein n=1 Tax=Triplophysa rosa TaxID=992332 RepID=A0A9W7W8U6_TRIRA|nr:hypothetical protein IRJ41_014104 [Triplophysa rosa]
MFSQKHYCERSPKSIRSLLSDVKRSNKQLSFTVFTSMVLTALKEKSEGDDILEEYKATNTLSNEMRRALVNILVGHMTEKHGRIPPIQRREQYALGIVTLFPSLKDPFSEKGYVNQDFELLFNLDTSSKLMEKWDRTLKPKMIQEAKRLTQTPAVQRLILSAEKSSEIAKDSGVLKCASNAADKLVVFHKSCCSIDEHLGKRQSHQPYLLAMGRSQDEIDHYIDLDSKLIPCQTAGSLCALDELFKVHYVFNISYDNALISFYTFLQTTVYNIDIGKTKESPPVKELRAKFLNNT